MHGYAKQGSGYGYSGVRGLNALIATVTTEHAAPVILGQRLRKGACGSARGDCRIVADTLATVRRLRSTETTQAVLLRAESAFYGHPSVAAAIRGGAQVSITVRLDSTVKTAIAAIGEQDWTPIEYTDAVYDETTRQWISRAEVAEIAFTAFSSRKATEQIPGRLVVRRIPDLNPSSNHGQGALFGTWRLHAFFTTSDLDTVSADKTHRGHAIIEQVHADLKDSALAHLPSGRFNANAAWLVAAVMAFNLTRAAATITGPALAKARTATIRATLITVPARIASSARRLTLHLPGTGHGNRPGTPCSTTYLDTTRRSSPNPHASSRPSTRKTHRNNPTPRPGHHPRPHDDPPLLQGTQPNSTPHPQRIGASRLSRESGNRRSGRTPPKQSSAPTPVGGNRCRGGRTVVRTFESVSQFPLTDASQSSNICATLLAFSELRPGDFIRQSSARHRSDDAEPVKQLKDFVVSRSVACVLQ